MNKYNMYNFELKYWKTERFTSDLSSGTRKIRWYRYQNVEVFVLLSFCAKQLLSSSSFKANFIINSTHQQLDMVGKVMFREVQTFKTF